MIEDIIDHTCCHGFNHSQIYRLSGTFSQKEILMVGLWLNNCHT